MASKSSGKSRKGTLLLVFAAFVIPVIVAKVALDNEWFNRGATNKGELIKPAMDMSPVLSAELPKWRLVYVMPENCDDKCENAVYSIRQVWLALGRESDRASATVVTVESSDATAMSQLGQHANLEVLSASKENVNKAFDSAPADGIFLVDTQNNAMLRYPLHADKDAAIQKSRDILADLKKLLKLSRIG